MSERVSERVSEWEKLFRDMTCGFLALTALENPCNVYCGVYVAA